MAICAGRCRRIDDIREVKAGDLMTIEPGDGESGGDTAGSAADDGRPAFADFRAAGCGGRAVAWAWCGLHDLYQTDFTLMNWEKAVYNSWSGSGVESGGERGTGPADRRGRFGMAR